MLPYLIRRTRGLMTAAALASILSGLFSVLLIAQINAALTSDCRQPRQCGLGFRGYRCGPNGLSDGVDGAV